MMDLENQILSFIESAENDPKRFDVLAIRLFEEQYEKIEPYRRFCAERNVTPSTVQGFQEIPPLPTSAFKYSSLTTFNEEDAVTKFHTSGTSEGNRGTHSYRSLKLYEASCLKGFEHRVSRSSSHFLSLIPSREEAPNSSLAYMTDLFAHKFETEQTVCAFHNGTIDPELAVEFLKNAEGKTEPAFIASTTIALTDLLQFLQQRNLCFRLPERSFLFETGGKKGRRSVPSTTELVRMAQKHLNIDSSSYYGEYGMTEISSPAWGRYNDGKLVYQDLPWAKVRIVSPLTMEDVDSGKEGMVAIFDLANYGSVSSLLTGDWGRKTEFGFEILGRAQETDLRGCSLQVSGPPHDSIPIHTAKIDEIQIAKTKVMGSALSSFKDRMKALAKLSQMWLDRAHPPRVHFEREICAPGIFSAGSVTAGLDRSFAELKEEKLPTSIDLKTPDSIWIQISAGNLPVTGLFGFYEAILKGTPTILRPSSKGGRLLHYLQSDLSLINPEIAKRVAILETSSSNAEETRELFRNASSISIQGDDLTIETLALWSPSSARVIKEGDRFSLIVLDEPEQLTREEYIKVCEDIYIWEQQGCLSPQIIFVKGNLTPTIKRLVEAAKQLSSEWRRVPYPRSHGSIVWQKLSKNLSQEPLRMVEHFSESLTVLETERIHLDLMSLPGTVQMISFSNLNDLDFHIGKMTDRVRSLSLQLPASSRFPKKISHVGLGELQSPKFCLTEL